MSKKSSTFAPAFEKEHVFLAQLVEQLTLNQWVQGSSPWEDTKTSVRVSFFMYFIEIHKIVYFFLRMCKIFTTFAR